VGSSRDTHRDQAVPALRDARQLTMHQGRVRLVRLPPNAVVRAMRLQRRALRGRLRQAASRRLEVTRRNERTSDLTTSRTMPLQPKHIHFLVRLDAAPLPVTVEDPQSIEMVRHLSDAGLLQAILPPYDETTSIWSGPAWVIRLTHAGLETARALPGRDGSSP